jgi:hypothetical protein
MVGSPPSVVDVFVTMAGAGLRYRCVVLKAGARMNPSHFVRLEPTLHYTKSFF